jgi:hypothetical protein
MFQSLYAKFAGLSIGQMATGVMTVKKVPAALFFGLASAL